MAPKKILIVDDEPLTVESIKFMLNSQRHFAEVARSGEEALEKFNPTKFDLVVTDYYMPGMKGDQLAHAIKSQYPHQPVLMLTAFPPEAGSVTVDLVLEKPCSMEKLREALSTVFSAS